MKYFSVSNFFLFALLSALALSLSACGSKENKESMYDGVYTAYETSITDTAEVIETRPMKITLKYGIATVYDQAKNEKIIEGEFSVKPAPKQSPLHGSQQINVSVVGSVFKPSIYYHEGKVFYLDVDAKPMTLTIFKK